jgi:tetratricopeptide (TPR) repeat protein
LTGLKKCASWATFKAHFALGAVIGAAELYDVVEFGRALERNLHAAGPHCYLLRNPKWFAEPVPCGGQLGIFGLPEDLTSQVEKQLTCPGKTVSIPDDILREIRPSPSEACFYQARTYLDAGLLEDALRRLDGAIRLDGSNASAYALKGLAYYRLERDEDALRELSQAIRLDPSNVECYHLRGECYRTLNRLAESSQDFQKVIELAPLWDMGYVLRGVNHHLAKNYSAAVADFQHARELNPKEPAPTLLKGVVLLESGKLSEGLEVLNEVEALFRDDPWPCYFVYLAYKKANQEASAAAALGRFKKKNGDEQEILDRLHELGFAL